MTQSGIHIDTPAGTAYISAMALPAVKVAEECADFSHTVLPFLSQLASYPSRLVDAGADLDALKQVYITTNPFITAVAFALFLVPVFLIASEVNKNYSQVDRFWSILPTVYNAHFAAWSHLNNVSSDTVLNILLFSFIWSTRLTFNYWRKGGYSIGSEDYRWQIVKNKFLTNPYLFFVFNLLFISFAQSILLVLITAPTYVLLVLSTLPEGESFGPPDYVFSRLLLFLIFVEFIADKQQWTFQSAKKEYQATARVPQKYKEMYTSDDLNRGFVVSGLWAWCRHPNFAAEQAIWFTLYQWACYKTRTTANWSGVGALSYVLLFQGSTALTEWISAGKYPDYKEYQLRVGKFIPRWGVEPRENPTVSSSGS